MKSLVAVAVLALLSVPAWADQPVPPSNDPHGIYRLHPNLETLHWVLVPPSEVKLGLVYNYYNESLKQRVWGIAREGGGFDYAFGEGTTIPTSMFDLRLTPEMEAEVLNRRSPGLLGQLVSVGRTAAVRLDGENVWKLLPFPSSARVFDLLTGQRWEWHGKNRHAVVHTGGNLWHIVEGRYLPMTIVDSVVSCR
jgi:hypothetical protein